MADPYVSETQTLVLHEVDAKVGVQHVFELIHTWMYTVGPVSHFNIDLQVNPLACRPALGSS